MPVNVKTLQGRCRQDRWGRVIMWKRGRLMTLEMLEFLSPFFIGIDRRKIVREPRSAFLDFSGLRDAPQPGIPIGHF